MKDQTTQKPTAKTTSKATLLTTPLIFGVSIHSVSTYEPARKIIEIIRKNRPEALIVTGG